MISVLYNYFTLTCLKTNIEIDTMWIKWKVDEYQTLTKTYLTKDFVWNIIPEPLVTIFLRWFHLTLSNIHSSSVFYKIILARKKKISNSIFKHIRIKIFSIYRIELKNHNNYYYNKVILSLMSNQTHFSSPLSMTINKVNYGLIEDDIVHLVFQTY